MNNYIVLDSNYTFVERLNDDIYEFNGVKLEKDNERYDIFDNGFIWFDSFGLSWNMSALNIVKKIDDTYDIVAIKEKNNE